MPCTPWVALRRLRTPGDARAVEVADPEDRAIVESDFAELAPVLG